VIVRKVSFKNSFNSLQFDGIEASTCYDSKDTLENKSAAASACSVLSHINKGRHTWALMLVAAAEKTSDTATTFKSCTGNGNRSPAILYRGKHPWLSQDNPGSVPYNVTFCLKYRFITNAAEHQQ
jgi:hypothetical protein